MPGRIRLVHQYCATPRKNGPAIDELLEDVAQLRPFRIQVGHGRVVSRLGIGQTKREGIRRWRNALDVVALHDGLGQVGVVGAEVDDAVEAVDGLTPAVAAEDGLGHLEVDIVEEARDEEVVHGDEWKTRRQKLHDQRRRLEVLCSKRDRGRPQSEGKQRKVPRRKKGFVLALRKVEGSGMAGWPSCDVQLEVHCSKQNQWGQAPSNSH